MKSVYKETGYFNSYDGTSLYYEVHGKGKPLILAYGIACLMNHWQHQIKYFSERYQVITFDYRGHHHSETPVDFNQLTVESLAKDLILLCEHLKIDQASFWGHSFGTQVLISAYAHNPELFNNLVFINGFAKNPLRGMFGSAIPTHIFQSARMLHDRLPQTFGYLWKSLIQNPLMIPMSGLAGGFNLELAHVKDIEIYAKGVASLPLDAFLTLFQNMIDFDGTETLEKIDVPTLIVSGAKDSLTPQKIQLQFHHQIRKSEFLAVPVGTHCTQLDLPDMVNLRIEKFLLDHSYS